ncbi:MAG: DUF5703 domain-containing protein [Phycisphaerae bacterium]|nr:DUF5703 domain-containing protein [Phycisphaerae bacterium]
MGKAPGREVIGQVKKEIPGHALRCVLALAVTVLCLPGILGAAEHWTTPYNVTWTQPSRNAAGSMPLGNGEVGINLWVEENGDLLFYISRNDSFSEISQLCKVGKVRISLSPNPFVAGQPFEQALILKDGVCVITAGPDKAKLSFSVFVDSAYPVVHVTGQSEVPIYVTAHVESWREGKQKVPGGGTAWTLEGAPFELWQTPDTFVQGPPQAVAWYHRNETSTAFESTVKVQSLEPIRDTMHDPLLHRTFGAWVTGDGFETVDVRTLATTGSVKEFSLRVASPCEQTPTAEAWLAMAQKAADACADPAMARSRTARAWQALWDRSHVVCDVTSSHKTPKNTLRLRIGVDAQGGSRFPGVVGAARVHGRALTSDALRTMANGTPETAVTQPVMPELTEGLTLEAWIKPEALTPGRILDKISVGGSDGFLLDTHPGGTLRMIVGSATLQAPGQVLRMGQWQHVAGTFDQASGVMRLFANGKLVAESGQGVSAAGGLGRQEAAYEVTVLTVGRAHTLQRYMQACAGRGLYPIKFNGSIFTVEPTVMGQGDNPDWRRWGDCHWWQNVRMPYHAMLAAGDFDLMHPLFNTFEAMRPFAEARARLYHQVEGCYFAETMTVWGTYANRDYGWDRTGLEPNDVQSPYWRYAWNQGLELAALMLDHYEYTRDAAFLESRLLPMATSVLKYFDTRFAKDADGRIVLDPTQSVETYWYDVVNDTPTAAGLNEVAARLCALPESAVSQDQRVFFRHMKAAAPEIPIEEVTRDGKTLRRIAVAQQYNPKRSNVENPELFPIWPFRLFGLGKPLLEEARNAYRLRGSHNDVGWGYDSNVAAALGLTEEAARILQVKIVNSRAGYRWPATWGPNFDWLPDQCHGGNLMNTIHLMLLQADGDTLRVLPAWPKDWDVSFKLHAPKNTTVECVYRGGKIETLKVTPASRLKDIKEG